LANGRINKPAGRNSNTSKQEIVIRTDRPVVVDATNHIAGRLASNVAKLLLQGQRVTVINCEKIMMSGTRSNQIKEYREFLEINSIINYKHGPVHYRRPDTIISKMIRGMLPYEGKPSGVAAFKRLRAYVGSPKELKSLEKIQFEKALIRKAASNYMTMGALCRVIGWTE
jgi:large subunit ribosomal protein L13